MTHSLLLDSISSVPLLLLMHTFSGYSGIPGFLYTLASPIWELLTAVVINCCNFLCRQAGGAFSKKEQAKEDQYFYNLVRWSISYSLSYPFIVHSQPIPIPFLAPFPAHFQPIPAHSPVQFHLQLLTVCSCVITDQGWKWEPYLGGDTGWVSWWKVVMEGAVNI